MSRPSSLTLAKPQILAYFAKAGPKVYTEPELAGLLAAENSTWRLVRSNNLNDFIAFLKNGGILKSYAFRANAYARTITRYAWGPVSPHALALSLKARGYLSHGTAAFLHKLIKPKPKTIYLNIEQSPKPKPRGGLTQDALDRTFAGEQRQSNYIFSRGPLSVTIIAGKNTEQLGVETVEGSSGEILKVTNLERTLVDITVRPAYAGGVDEVLKAYRTARNRVSIDRLLGVLDELAYVYPYHQAIGFLMQSAGYSHSDHAKLSARAREYDFYLAHGMKEPQYSKEWRLYYPRDLKIPRNARTERTLRS
jgi:hypothetical protein